MLSGVYFRELCLHIEIGKKNEIVWEQTNDKYERFLCDLLWEMPNDCVFVWLSVCLLFYNFRNFRFYTPFGYNIRYSIAVAQIRNRPKENWYAKWPTARRLNKASDFNCMEWTNIKRNEMFVSHFITAKIYFKMYIIVSAPA